MRTSEGRVLPQGGEVLTLYRSTLLWPSFCAVLRKSLTFKGVKPRHSEWPFLNGEKFLGKVHISMNIFVLIPTFRTWLRDKKNKPGEFTVFPGLSFYRERTVSLHTPVSLVLAYHQTIILLTSLGWGEQSATELTFYLESIWPYSFVHVRVF